MRALIYATFLFCGYIINAHATAFDETVEASSFFDLFPTLFRLKRSLIDNSGESVESQESTQRFKPPPSKQFEQYIFQLILQAHSLTLGNLRDIYVESNGDARSITAKLNQAFGKEILYIDDEDFLRVNCDEYLRFFNGYISQISKETPYLDTLLNNVLKPYISTLQVTVEEFRVPIDTILERVKPHIISKRSIIPKNETSLASQDEDNEGTDDIINFLQVVVEWLRNAAKNVVALLILQLNTATHGLFLPAFELLQSFLIGIIDSIKVSI